MNLFSSQQTSVVLLVLLACVPGCKFDPLLGDPGKYAPCKDDGTCHMGFCECVGGQVCVPVEEEKTREDCIPACLTHQDCDDGDPCTLDHCDPQDNSCDNDHEQIPGAEGPGVPGSCENELDDDCDGETDKQDPDCPCTADAGCDDQNPCTANRCELNACSNPPLADGTPCDDGRWCTQEDTCIDGECEAEPRVCRDDNPCSIDTCSEAGDECRHEIHEQTEEICWDEFDQDCDEIPDGCCLGDGEFAPLGSLSTLPQPLQVESGDFDNDGVLDLVVTSAKGIQSPLQVFPGQGSGGRGDGAFLPTVQVDAGTSPASVHIQDLNADGNLDLAVADFATGEVHLLFGGSGGSSGNPGFAPLESFATCPGAYPIVSADFDRDGLADLAVGCTVANGPHVKILLGAKEAASPHNYSLVPGPEITLSASGGSPAEGILSLAAGDFNADHRPDLAVAPTGADGISVLLSCESTECLPSLFHPTVPSLPLGGQPSFITAADFDRDGILDLAVSVMADSGSDQVAILKGGGGNGQGDGSFVSVFDRSYSHQPGPLAVADYDGNGLPDIVVCEEDADHVSVLLSRGDNGRWEGSFQLESKAYPGDEPRWVHAADLDSDGVLDLAVTRQHPSDDNATGSVEIFKGTGSGGFPDGTFRALPPIQEAGQGCFSLVAADFDSDGISDLAVVNRLDNQLAVLLGDGQDARGEASFELYGTCALPLNPSRIVVADFDQDHIPDLAVLSQENRSVSVLRGEGTGGWATGVFLPSREQDLPGGFGDGHSITPGDFDLDGSPDLAVSIPSLNQVVILSGYENTAGQPFARVQLFEAGYYPVSVLAADFNEDGKTDLATAGVNQAPEAAGSVNILLNTYDAPNYTIAFDSPLSYWITGSLRGLSAGDFNADGITDLAVAVYNGSEIQILEGNGLTGVGDGSFTWGASFPVGHLPSRIVSLDLNADNILDLAVLNQASNSVSILQGSGSNGRGDGGFTRIQDIPVGASPQDLVAGRFNADGFIDLATANSGSHDISILLGQGSCIPP